MSPSLSLAAGESRYRVEILVLGHLDSAGEASEAAALEDFSGAVDFLNPQPEFADESQPPEAATDEPARDPAEPAEAAAETGDRAESPPDGEVAEDPWNVLTHVADMGPQMQDAWRRLRLSASFRPLQFLAWEQGGSEPFPVLRIHDLEAVQVDDPWATQRLGAQLAEALRAGGTAPGESDLPGGLPQTPAPAPADGTTGPAEALPDPIIRYRLDGTASLRRSRFLHLSLAVEWRETSYGADPLGEAVSDQPQEPAEATTALSPSSWRVHRLEQSRPVSTGRMEYFDGPFLGVLAWITDISDTVEAAAFD